MMGRWTIIVFLCLMSIKHVKVEWASICYSPPSWSLSAHIDWPLKYILLLRIHIEEGKNRQHHHCLIHPRLLFWFLSIFPLKSRSHHAEHCTCHARQFIYPVLNIEAGGGKCSDIFVLVKFLVVLKNISHPLVIVFCFISIPYVVHQVENLTQQLSTLSQSELKNVY